MSNDTSLRARFAALGVTPLFVGTNGEVFDARRTAVAQALPDLFDNDRDRVVRAWRSAGIPCAQVADGDF